LRGGHWIERLVSGIFLRALGLRTDEEILKTFYTVDTITVAGGKLRWRGAPEGKHTNLQGTRPAHTISHKSEELAPATRKISAHSLKALRQHKIEAVEVETSEFDGAMTASDVVDLTTGELLYESNQELTDQAEELETQRRALEHNEVFAVEDLATEDLKPDELSWLDAGYHGFAAIALAPPLERPVGVLALLRRTPWRLDRRDAVRLEDLAGEAVAALRAHSLAIKVEEVAVLQERISLAREIHDGLASDLAAVVALFKYYEQRRERDPDDAAELLPQIRGMTEEILAGARNILQSLRPRTIRSEGLMASAIKAVDQFGRVNLVETTVDIRGEENGLNPEQKEVIFQVLRESLSNIRKHSQARNVWVTLDLSAVPWVMTVRDDGRGFDVRRVADPRVRRGAVRGRGPARRHCAPGPWARCRRRAFSPTSQGRDVGHPRAFTWRRADWGRRRL